MLFQGITKTTFQFLIDDIDQNTIDAIEIAIPNVHVYSCSVDLQQENMCQKYVECEHYNANITINW